MLEARQRQLEQTISSMTDSLANKQSTIDTLQLQVVIYREDFQSERQDRERAQSQIAELQAQLNQLEQSRQRASTSAAPQVRRNNCMSTNSQYGYQTELAFGHSQQRLIFDCISIGNCCKDPLVICNKYYTTFLIIRPKRSIASGESWKYYYHHHHHHHMVFLEWPKQRRHH